MKNALLGIVKCIAVWIITLSVLIGLLVASACIPNEKINDSLTAAAMEYMPEEPRPVFNPTAYHSIQDNYADVILLGIISCVSSGDPFTSSINTIYYDGEDYGPAYGLYASVLGVKGNTDYTRYWHGSMTFIRPLLTITDISGIKTVSGVVMIILTGISCFMLFRRKNAAAAVILILSLLSVQAFFVTLSLEYIVAFMVMLFLLPLYIFFAEKDNVLLLLSVSGGTLIAFNDFLTAETITFFVPFLIVLFIRIRNKSFGGFKEGLILTAKCGGGWLTAYIFTFVSKWVFATAVTGENKFTAAIASVNERTSGSAADFDNPVEQIFSALFANLSMLFPTPEKISPIAVILAVIIYIGIPVVFILAFRKKEKSGIIPLLLIIAAVPIVRFLLLSNHSYLHNFFTYRALCITVIAMLGAAWYSLDKNKLPFFKQTESVPSKKGGKK